VGCVGCAWNLIFVFSPLWPQLKRKPAAGTFFMLLPVKFNLEDRYDYAPTPMPIPFGEKFHFHSCEVGRREGLRRSQQQQAGEQKRGVVEDVVTSVLLSSEEEKAAAREASL